MSLAQQECVPCKGGLQPLSATEAEDLLKQVPGWNVTDNATWLKRELKFKNWRQAFAFLKKLDVLAEAEGHHPDISFGWGYCNIAMQTHALGGLHQNDFIMAAKISDLLEEE